MLGVLFDFLAMIALDAVERFGAWLAKERSPWIQAFVDVGCSLLALFLVFGICVLISAPA
ncbi:MAG: hypothetical protein LH610_12580 [Sphingomonas bacterium]|nr:hypothetical protein [Sphingomonas bacterium]